MNLHTTGDNYRDARRPDLFTADGVRGNETDTGFARDTKITQIPAPRARRLPLLGPPNVAVHDPGRHVVAGRRLGQEGRLLPPVLGVVSTPRRPPLNPTRRVETDLSEDVGSGRVALGHGVGHQRDSGPQALTPRLQS